MEEVADATNRLRAVVRMERQGKAADTSNRLWAAAKLDRLWTAARVGRLWVTARAIRLGPFPSKVEQLVEAVAKTERHVPVIVAIDRLE